MAALEIIVTVRDGQTMSQYKMPKSEKVKFNNADPAATLKITGKEGKPWPFCDQDHTTPKPQPIEVAPGGVKAAWICNSFTGGEVLYTAQIGTAVIEDPIIIFERQRLLSTVEVAALGGVALGAVTAVVVMRLLRSKPRRG